MNFKTSRTELNSEQKKAAYCTENAVVAAGAGSGKTMVLANRFAWLLTEKGYKVNEILTLTFTKKAAAQMFRRIYSLVSEIAENETGIKAERARQALNDFVHARIQTLDSYSASIVKQSALRYGISPDFKIDQDRCRKLALEVSYPYIITHRNNSVIKALYSANSPDGIACNIFADTLFNYSRIDKALDHTSDIKKQFDSLCIEWEKYCDELKTILEETASYLYENKTLLPSLVPIMEKYKKGEIKILKYSDIREYLDQALASPPEEVIEKTESSPIRKILVNFLYFLSSINDLNLKEGKRSDNPVKDNVKKIRELFNPLASLVISCMQAGFNISIMALLAELQDIYLDKKRSEGVLTFRDVANLSRTILIEQNDIRQSEKESFKAIMIDEFQDNNELQKDLLFLLAEKSDIINKCVPPPEDLSPGKLFFVGDEKQSIYLFRGADVSVFRKLKEEIKSSELSLKINYRSAPALINAFNVIFGSANNETSPSVFARSKSLPPYEASYTPLEAGTDGSGKLTICMLNKNADNEGLEEDNTFLSADENEARFVAEKIRKLLDEKTDSGGQKYQGNDIAVLLRTRSSQHLFERHLRLLDVPYTCEDINNLFYGELVNDILSVIRLAVYPADSESYAEMLRSPFAGLSLSGTAVCLSSYLENKENPLPFDDKPIEYLDKEDQKKYRNGQKIYLSISKKAEKESICSLLNELWYEEGYRYETEWNPQTGVYRELFDYLFHLAAKADSENLGAASFADNMRAFMDSGGQLSEIEIPAERPGAVHLMTIHKSKGLEFPVVFLCGCGKKSQPDSYGAVYFSKEAGLVFNSPVPPSCRPVSGKQNNFFWQLASDETKRKRTAELRRLLYVGATRAEKELYITGSIEIKNPDLNDDFPGLLKNHIQKKCADNENFINGDTILNNDTFFGLLLPSIAWYISSENKENGNVSGSSFFNLEEIPVYTEEYLKKQAAKNKGFANDQNGINEFIAKAESFYQNAEIINTPVLYDSHKSPVSLQNIDKDGDNICAEDLLPGKGFFINRTYSGKEADDVFKKVDSLLSGFAQSDGENTEKFNSGGFGTIAHICVEALINQKEPLIPVNISGSLTPSQMNTFLKAGMELARRFLESPMGKIAGNSKLRESEFPFRSFIKNKEGDEVFIGGTIDLFFEDGDSIHVVDFKTDIREAPGEHVAQMACYYHAVLSLFALPLKKECRIWLYYLRTGHAMELTERVKQFNLEQRVFARHD
ncbi:MAG: UvrD-helicase domain-containing protein [Treponema sp.]|jgi:ATP-dependent helicase/nuclease subunit A|nr:UvrD-helicase domain-containing protein [Treponema sp.]